MLNAQEDDPHNKDVENSELILSNASRVYRHASHTHTHILLLMQKNCLLMFIYKKILG